MHACVCVCVCVCVFYLCVGLFVNIRVSISGNIIYYKEYEYAAKNVYEHWRGYIRTNSRYTCKSHMHRPSDATHTHTHTHIYIYIYIYILAHEPKRKSMHLTILPPAISKQSVRLGSLTLGWKLIEEKENFKLKPA